jgi:hypothetical protein
MKKPPSPEAQDWLRELGDLSAEEVPDILPEDGTSTSAAPEKGGDSAKAKPAKAPSASFRKGGKEGKAGNLAFDSGGYWVSLPPDPDKEWPLVILFGGDTGKGVMVKAAEPLLTLAIVVASENSGNFAGAMASLNPLLGDKTKVGKISICGYSSGGYVTYREYGKATKAVGLIDPTTMWSHLKVLDGKAVMMCNPRIWKYWNNKLFLAGNPDKAKHDTYTVEDAQKEAVDIINAKGGSAVIEDYDHGKYPEHFLKLHAGDLV